MNKKHKAAFTLEAAIVMPTILIAIFAVLFAFQLIYQHVVIEYAASFGAGRGALYWGYKMDSVDFIKGTAGEKEGLYYSTAEILGLKGADIAKKKEKIKSETQEVIKKLTIIGGNADVKVDYNKSLLGQNVVVEVNQEINVPFKMLLTYFNGGDMKLTARSTASLYNPDEYIRNIDYAYELSKTIIDKVAGSIDKIREKAKI